MKHELLRQSAVLGFALYRRGPGLAVVVSSEFRGGVLRLRSSHVEENDRCWRCALEVDEERMDEALMFLEPEGLPLAQADALYQRLVNEAAEFRLSWIAESERRRQ